MNFFPSLDSVTSNLIAGAIIALLSPAVVLLARWIIKKINISISGIRRLYPRGKNLRSVKKAIEKADELCVIAIAAQGFLNEHRDTIETRLRTFPAFKMRLLLVNPQAQHSTDLERMFKQERGHNKELQATTISVLNTINDRTGSLNTPFFEVRRYRTEFRNPTYICKRRERDTDLIQTWVNLTMPQAARNSPTFLLDAEKSIMHYKQFDELWNYYDPEKQKTTAASKQAAKK